MLINLDISLKRNGFPKVFRKYAEKYAMPIDTVFDYQEEQLSAMHEHLLLIDKVCSDYPFEAKCLHRSFLGYRVLGRKYGINIDLVIGVRKAPFYAHAWLMCDGMNFNENEEVTNGLSIILSSAERTENVDPVLRRSS